MTETVLRVGKPASLAMGLTDEGTKLRVCLYRRNLDISGRMWLAVQGTVVVSMLGVGIDWDETLVVWAGALLRVY